MWARCTSRKGIHWSGYGGRGISVDPRWQEFAVFLADMGERPAGRTLDRIDNMKDYTYANCRWATPVEQASNRRDSIMFDGVLLRRYAEDRHIGRSTAYYRYHHNLPIVR